MKIAIIGAGFSGANLYRLLKQNSKYSITVFEKSRGAGGRCSSKYLENSKVIDHGTPFFKAKNREFKNFCEELVDRRILKKVENEYHPESRINEICSSQIDNKDLKTNTKIVFAESIDNRWILKDDKQNIYKDFDRLIITIPVPQILDMEIKLSNKIKKSLKRVEYSSIATLIIYANSLDIPKSLIEDSRFKKVVNNSKKYGYKKFDSYVFHLNSDTTKKLNINSKEAVKEEFLKIFKEHNFEINGNIIPHYWKYAFVKSGIDSNYLYNKNSKLGFCGDYFGDKDLETSFISSKALYNKIKEIDNDFTEVDQNRLIEMAWQDRMPFDIIKLQYNLTENQVKNIMRKFLSKSSYKMWRKRVQSRKTKHIKKCSHKPSRFQGPW
jgi:uncharacterized protein (TIGR03643 family)